MKFKDYLNSLVSRRKNNSSSSKAQQPTVHRKNPTDLTSSADCHYDICGYEDVNGVSHEDHHTRTQILLARHAELVNTIVETRSSHENPFAPCVQCRMGRQCSPLLSSAGPPALPPKVSPDSHTPILNRHYSSTLATCSPRRECQLHQRQAQQQQQHQQQLYYQSPLSASQYSTPNPSGNSSSSSSLWTTTASLSKKQRSRIRTNPWITKPTVDNRTSTFIDTSPHQPSPEYGIYDPTYRGSPVGMTHSESFPQATPANGNSHVTTPPSPPTAALLPVHSPAPAPASSAALHQSDSGHGFSLASSRVIDSSSSDSPPPSSTSPDDTSADGMMAREKPAYRQKKLRKKTSSISPLTRKKSPKRQMNTEQNVCANTISSDSGSLTRRTRARQKPLSAAAHHRHQRSSATTKGSPVKPSIDQKPSHSSSSQSIDDHFSLEFEEILENERSCPPRKEKIASMKASSPTKSPFILPLDDAHMTLPAPPPPILFTSTLTKTNSRAILKHIEEIENEIRLIKNLDLANDDDEDEYAFSPHAYPEEDIDLDASHETELQVQQPSIYDQVDRWVEKCLTTSNSPGNRASLLQTECDHLSNTIKDYVVCVCPEDDRPSSASEPASELLTTFYLSSLPARATKRTSSFIAAPRKLHESSCATEHLQAIRECPF